MTEYIKSLVELLEVVTKTAESQAEINKLFKERITRLEESLAAGAWVGGNNDKN